MTKEVGRGGVAREEEGRSTEKGCRRGLLGVSLTLKGHKLIETRGRRETKGEIHVGLPGIAENIRRERWRGGKIVKIVEHQH